MTEEIDGPVKKVGIDRQAWDSLTEDIIQAIYPIAHEQGQRYLEHHLKKLAGG